MGKHPQEAPAQTAEFVSPTQTATFTETAVFQPGKRTAAGRAPRKDGKPAFRGSAHGEGRRPMNRENNAPFADRAPREGGKPAFRGSAHGEGKPAFRRDSKNRPPRKPKGSVRGAQPSDSQEFAANPPYRPWKNTRKKSPRKPRNS